MGFSTVSIVVGTQLARLEAIYKRIERYTYRCYSASIMLISDNSLTTKKFLVYQNIFGKFLITLTVKATALGSIAIDANELFLFPLSAETKRNVEFRHSKHNASN